MTDEITLEQALADVRAILDSVDVDDIEKSHALLEELKAIYEELERRLKTPERNQ